MKRLFMALLCAALLITAGGCGKGNAPSTPLPGSTAPQKTPDVQQTPGKTEGAALKTGLAVVTDVASSKSAGEEAGVLKANEIAVVVTVDAAGVISSCVIDALDAEVGFTGKGKVESKDADGFLTKRELGGEYGMKKASEIGREWYEQTAALAEYVTGKTADEVKGIALTEGGAAEDADIASSCSIAIGGFIDAIVKAAESADELGAKPGDKLGLGTVTTTGNSKDAAKGEPGLAQAYSTYAVVTVDGGGVISSCLIDTVQAGVNFDAEGNITSDTNTAVLTKNELGANYGMAGASSIGREWNEQAAAFAAYCVGKTMDEVKGIAMDDSGYAEDGGLRASVTIHIGDFIKVVAKAAADAK